MGTIPVITRGAIWGRMPPAQACPSLRQPAGANEWPDQRLYGDNGNGLVVHGKEKVYGSIP
jgi:hypothetical protein